ncbi:MAG: protein-glutamate O-methyltransferase, partial [Desulfobacterales bacterium]
DVSHLVHRLAGIHLKENKKALVRSRLMKRLRSLGLTSFDDYMALLSGEKGPAELGSMIDAITTNKTGFFREKAHFDYLSTQVLPQLGGKMRFWSAACSSGQEPYTLAIALRENLPAIDGQDVKILATDISAQMLAKAKTGVYPHPEVADIPPDLLCRYFIRGAGAAGGQFTVKAELRRLVTFGWINLMAAWPMKGPFDVIFCRNVMIYFDKATQQRLVNRFWELLSPDGYLFVGHAEGLSAIEHKFRYVQPAVYIK